MKKTLKELFNHPKPILTDGAFYLFNPEVQIQSDVDEFKHHFHIGKDAYRRGNSKEANLHFKKAMELYQGDFLENFLHCQWCIYDREEIRNQYLELMYLMAKSHRLSKDYPEAIFLYKKILEMDNTREASHRGIMQCYCLLYTSPSPRDRTRSRMPSSA